MNLPIINIYRRVIYKKNISTEVEEVTLEDNQVVNTSLYKILTSFDSFWIIRFIDHSAFPTYQPSSTNNDTNYICSH